MTAPNEGWRTAWGAQPQAFAHVLGSCL